MTAKEINHLDFFLRKYFGLAKERIIGVRDLMFGLSFLAKAKIFLIIPNE